ncbi:MAG: virulence-associated E family protein [Lachnospiraceae bacterium]|nr:virulence-associated E family protein [Lachnospiraceae bacterium]
MSRESETLSKDEWLQIGDILDTEYSSVDEIRNDLIKTEKGILLQGIENCLTVFHRDPLLRGAIRRNELTNRTDIVKDLGWLRYSGTTITDLDEYQIQLYFEKNYGLKNAQNIDKAISIVASENRYHPIREKLESLEWDGVERIKHVMPKYLGVDEDEYSESVMTLLLTAGVKRIYEPGCKYDIMVCLVGGQGAGKSTFFRFLALNDDWFSDDLKRIDDEQVYRKMQGHWIIEMSEMLATVNAKSVEEIKSFLSRTKETYKIPYETHPEDRPRQCIFVGTSNDMQFLPFDTTGNRRFVPIRVHQDRIEKHILEDETESREYFSQVWAEFMVLYRKNKQHDLKLPPKMEAYLKEIQADFMPEDSNIGIIQEWLDSHDYEYVCSRQIYDLALKREGNDPKQWELKKINDIMNNSIQGWAPVSSHRFAGTTYGTQRAWKRVSETEGSRAALLEEIPFK